MRYILFVLSLSLSTLLPVMADNGLVMLNSPYTVQETEARLVNVLKAKGMKIFARIDHAAAAKRAGIELDPTRLVLFGNPKVGTPLMHCGRTAAIDLPMKMLIWEENGKVRLAYNSPAWLEERHGLQACKKILGKVDSALHGLALAAVGK